MPVESVGGVTGGGGGTVAGGVAGAGGVVLGALGVDVPGISGAVATFVVEPQPAVTISANRDKIGRN